MECTQLSLFGKTYPELSAPTEEKISEPCWKNLPAWNSQTLLFLDLRGGGRWSKAGAIAGAGWSLAWRQLDAQYWGVPQRRKRISLVADFGGQRAAEILFERTGLSGNPDEGIPTWKAVTRYSPASPSGRDSERKDAVYALDCLNAKVIQEKKRNAVRETKRRIFAKFSEPNSLHHENSFWMRRWQ